MASKVAGSKTPAVGDAEEVLEEEPAAHAAAAAADVEGGTPETPATARKAKRSRDRVESLKQRKCTQTCSVRLRSGLSVPHVSSPGQILEISERERRPSLCRGT